MRFERLSLVLVAALAVGVSACGSDSADTSTTSEEGEPDTSTAAHAVVRLGAERLGIEIGGSGFVYDLDKGLVATSAQNVIAADDIVAGTAPGTPPIKTEVAGLAPCDDVAVLKLSGGEDSEEGLEELDLGASSELEADQEVTAVGYGNEFGGADTGTVKASRGPISEPDLSDQELTPDLPSFPALIEFDAALEPGFDGGALLAESGEAVGMLVSSDLAERTPSYAIPSQRLRALLEELAGGAHPLDEGWLLRPLDKVNLAQEFQLFLAEKLEQAGFTPQEAAEHVRELDLPPGMYVLATERKGPADKTNIFPGDMITKIDGEPVATQGEVCSALEDAGNEAEVDGVAITSSTRIADIGEKFTVVLKIR